MKNFRAGGDRGREAPSHHRQFVIFDDTGIPPGKFPKAVNRFHDPIRGGLVGMRRGVGPFYEAASYVGPADRLDKSDLVLGRDYSGQYEVSIWRDDA